MGDSPDCIPESPGGLNDSAEAQGGLNRNSSATAQDGPDGSSSVQVQSGPDYSHSVGSDRSAYHDTDSHYCPAEETAPC